MEELDRAGEGGPTLTVHSRTRMQQRGITARMIHIALEYGERRWSHGAACYRLTERALCGTQFVAESDRLRGLCVVVARDGKIVTVKWDTRFRKPGPLRRANAANWNRLRSPRYVVRDEIDSEALSLAA